MFNDSECIHDDLWLRDTVSLIAVRQRPERRPPGGGAGGGPGGQPFTFDLEPEAQSIKLASAFSSEKLRSGAGNQASARRRDPTGCCVEALRCRQPATSKRFKRNSWRGRVFLHGASEHLEDMQEGGRRGWGGVKGAGIGGGVRAINVAIWTEPRGVEV